jgi:alpha-L-fucosidase
MKKTVLTLAFILVGFCTCVFAQEEQSFVKETDPAVVKKLDWWQDVKFGLLMHWGPYSQWGVVESWSICPEDEGWCARLLPDYNEYKRRYEGLKYSFNPVRFNPDKWAAAAKDAGMKYVVFTTKHHDGFCMFDTKYTDYKITSLETPFHKNPKANIAKEIFSSFRKEGLGIGAYFSKPDWHSPDYWSPEFPPLDRNVNYDPEKYPERWKKFAQFTYNQIEELMTGYGSVDILWLDGGWVRPRKSQTPESLTWTKRILNQDINMAGIAGMARKLQPGLIVVDRSVHGQFENYRTPEQQVPDKPLPYYWETCMTMANSWSWTYNDTYKPTNKIIHLLIDIVSKGGNFLLNIGPDPTGDLDETAYSRLHEIGAWMKVNSGAIYGSRPVEPYKEGKVCFTQGKKGEVFALYLADENEAVPSEIKLENFQPKTGAIATLLGGGKVSWKAFGKGCVITLPASVKKNPPCQHAWVVMFN